ncbi:MAG: zinc-binding dehydrogenase, partial [Nitrospinae bacterium]|nr:zinc-binding dehydrogenase [Nitrospinota bacterium]
PVGMCALAAAKYVGARVIAIDAVAERLEVAREMGADETIDVREHDSVSAVQDLTGGHGADAVLEVVGGAQNKTMAQAFEMARKGGRIVVVGAFSVDAPIQLEHLQHLEKEIIGSRGHPDTFEVCIDLAARGALNIKPMITHRIPLSMVHRGIEMMRERKDGAIKVVLLPNQES